MRDIDIAYDPDGNLFVVWTESNRIMTAYSTDHGSTWSAPQEVKGHTSPENPSYTQSYPTVAGDGDYVVIAWETDVHFKKDVYLSRSSTSSLSGYPTLGFDAPHRVPKPIVYPMYRTYNPRMVAEEGVIHIAWWDFSTDPNGNNNADPSIDRPCIKYTKSTNGGSTWGVGGKDNVVVNTSTPDGWHSKPDIEVGPDGFLAVAWIDTTMKNKNVFAAVSSDGGATWSAQARANNYDPTSEKFPPKLAIDSSKTVHVSWISRDTPTSDLDITHSRTIINQPPEPVEDLTLIFAEEYDAMVGWSINEEPDFQEYNIHLDTTINFTLTEDNLIKSTTNQGLNRYTFEDIVPNTDYYLKIEVKDKEGLTANSQELHFKTLPINQPPIFIKQVPTIYLLEDTNMMGALNLSYWVDQGWITDDNYAGQTELQFSIESVSEEPKVNAIIRDRGFDNPYWIMDVYTNTPNWAGTEKFMFNVTDAGKDGGFGTPDDRYSLSDPFNITVNSTNDIPIWKTYQDLNTNQQIQIRSDQTELILKPSDTGCIERQKYRFAMIGSDIDGDFITYTITEPRIEIERDLIKPDVKSIFTFTPTNDDVPEINFTIKADDGNGGTRNITIYLPILNVNDAPFFKTVDGEEVEPNGDTVEFSVEEKGSFSFNVTAGDIDHGDQLTLTSSNERANIQKTNDNNWTVTFTAREEDSIEGEVNFQIQLLDLQKTDLVFLNVKVNIINIQDRPEWISGREKIEITYTFDQQDTYEWGGKPGGSEIRAEWGETITFEGFATDKDEDTLTYTWWFATEDESGNWSREGKKVDFAFEPSEGGLENPVREKFTITLTVSDGQTEPIQYYRELWVERDDDNDNDGLPDKREIYFWGDLSHGPDEDEDDDGYTNIQEIGFQIPRYDSEMTGVYSLNKNEINPADAEVYPGQVKPVDEGPEEEEDEEPLGLPTWVLVTIIIVVIIVILIIAGIFVIVTLSKRREQKEEEDLEKRVQEMDRRQKEISGLYGRTKDEDFDGPDQSTLDDLQLDLGGQLYHEEGSSGLAKGVKKGELGEGDTSPAQKKQAGPQWESGTGPKFESSAPGLTFGESLSGDTVENPDELVEDVDEEDLNASMDALLNAAEEYDETQVQSAGGRVMVGAVPMEEQIKQMNGQEGSGGPRLPPPGQEDQKPRGMPPGQKPPQMGAPPGQVALPKVGEKEEED
jgi:hypothetical protein